VLTRRTSVDMPTADLPDSHPPGECLLQSWICRGSLYGPACQHSRPLCDRKVQTGAPLLDVLNVLPAWHDGGGMPVSMQVCNDTYGRSPDVTIGGDESCTVAYIPGFSQYTLRLIAAACMLHAHGW